MQRRSARLDDVCTHDKYVRVCDSFLSLSFNDRIAILIHEAMHVGGQIENPSGNTGGTTPPSSPQISDVVKLACGL
jgi:predicted metallopeptidase